MKAKIATETTKTYVYGSALLEERISIDLNGTTRVRYGITSDTESVSLLNLLDLCVLITEISTSQEKS